MTDHTTPSAAPRVLSSGSLTGNDVKNTAGEDLGTIKEIMLDTQNNRIAYAVVSFGGFLGLGDKLFAIPWDAMSVDYDNHCFILNVDKETLEEAPGFDKDDWPRFANPEWANQVYSHYKLQPYW